MTTEEQAEQPRARRSRKQTAADRPAGIRSWASAALGAFVLVLCGFVVGLGLGIVSEEPDIVASHVMGGSEEVTLGAETIEVGEEVVVVSAVREPDSTHREPPAAEAESPQVSAPPRPVAAKEPEPAAPAVSASPPAVSAPPVSPATSGGWVIQVGAFSRSSSADALAESLKAKGFQTYLKPSSGSADGRWRVRVGPLPTQLEAQQLARRLEREESLSTWVLSEGGG